MYSSKLEIAIHDTFCYLGKMSIRLRKYQKMDGVIQPTYILL